MLLSAAHRTFSKINHTIGHKASLNNFRKVEITLCRSPGHKGIRLNICNDTKDTKHSNSYKLNNILLNETRMNEKIKKKHLSFPELNKNENTIYQNPWDTMKVVLR